MESRTGCRGTAGKGLSSQVILRAAGAWVAQGGSWGRMDQAGQATPCHCLSHCCGRRPGARTSSPCLCLSLSVSLPASRPRGAASSSPSGLTAPELALACPLSRAQLRGLHGDRVGATEGVLMKAKHPAQLFLARTTCQQGERGVSRVGAPRTPAERPGRTELWGSQGCSGHPPSGRPAAAQPSQQSSCGPESQGRAATPGTAAGSL